MSTQGRHPAESALDADLSATGFAALRAGRTTAVVRFVHFSLILRHRLNLSPCDACRGSTGDR